MKVFQPTDLSPHTISGNLIKNITGDLHGSVFVHTQNGIDRYDLRSQQFSHLVDMQEDALCYGDEQLWFAKANRVYRYEGDHPELFCEIPEVDQIQTS